MHDRERRLPCATGLLAWLSPAFPVGAYTYSQAWSRGRGRRCVRDRPGWSLARDRARRRRRHGSTRAAGRSLAGRRGRRCDRPRRLSPTGRRPARHGRDALESARRAAFLDTVAEVWPDRLARAPGRDLAADEREPGLRRRGRRRRRPRAACRSRPRSPPISTPSPPAWSRPAVRLVPLGQTDGQRALAALEPRHRWRPARPRSARPLGRDRLGDAHGSTWLLDAARDPVHAAVPLMSNRPAPGRDRRPGRLRQDRADGPAVQGACATAATSPRSPTTSTPARTPSS